ncbi:MAG: hypothetical protein ACTS22_07155 [Phycisphaerales bacterium]
MVLDRMTAGLAGLVMAAGLVGVAGAQDGTAPAETQERATAELPDGFVLLEKHLEASGGAEAGLALEGVRMAGSFSMPAMGINGEITISFKAPSMQIIEINLGAMGAMVQGTDGTVAWASPQPGLEPEVVTGPQAEQLLQQGRFKDRYAPRELYTEAVTVAKDEIDGEPYYRVELKDKNGEESVALFHAGTGLQHKEMTRVAPNAPTFASEVTFLDYRTVDGLVFPFKMVIAQGPMEQEVVFTEIEVNPDYAEGAFSPPGEM